MKNTFFNKVVAERKVLSIVNLFYKNKLQLTGLSAEAINSWRHKITLEPSSEIINILHELGELCQCLSNRSHESFSPLNPELEQRIDEYMRQLKNELNKIHGMR